MKISGGVFIRGGLQGGQTVQAKPFKQQADLPPATLPQMRAQNKAAKLADKACLITCFICGQFCQNLAGICHRFKFKCAAANRAPDTLFGNIHICPGFPRGRALCLCYHYPANRLASGQTGFYLLLPAWHQRAIPFSVIKSCSAVAGASRLGNLASASPSIAWRRAECTLAASMKGGSPTALDL